MKTSHDPRHRSRIHTMQGLFSWDFQHNTLSDETALKVIENIEQINQEIIKAAPEWPIGQISRIDLAILRLAIFELIINKDAPFKVVVDEAVELGKEFGGESSPSFINGVLGNVIKAHNLDQKGEKE